VKKLRDFVRIIRRRRIVFDSSSFSSPHHCSSSQSLSCTRASLTPHLNLTTTITSPTHETTWIPTPSSPMPKTTTFPLSKTKLTSLTSSKKIHSNKTNRRNKMQKATDRIELGFRATYSTISAGPSKGCSTSTRSTSGMTFAQGLRIGGVMKPLKWLKERRRERK
jgi:hypothetical protein